MHLFDYVKADLLARDGDGLILQCDENLSGRHWVEAWVAGETIHIRLQIVAELGVEDEDTPLYLAIQMAETLTQLCRRLERPPMKHFYQATIRRPLEFAPLLDVLLEPAPHPVEHRARTRIGHHIRAMSAELPGYRGTVRNISEKGIGLDLAGPIQKGQKVALRLEPDGGRDVPFDIEAEVCWCNPTRPEIQGRAPDEAGRAHAFEAGLRYLPMTREGEVSLRVFLESFDGAEH
ncbi:PilZ domain-containing protein [bacterium]|nr:PilZ domain-containing protein [bacterium]